MKNKYKSEYGASTVFIMGIIIVISIIFLGIINIIQFASTDVSRNTLRDNLKE